MTWTSGVKSKFRSAKVVSMNHWNIFAAKRNVLKISSHFWQWIVVNEKKMSMFFLWLSMTLYEFVCRDCIVVGRTSTRLIECMRLIKMQSVTMKFTLSHLIIIWSEPSKMRCSRKKKSLRVFKFIWNYLIYVSLILCVFVSVCVVFSHQLSFTFGGRN